ncbi:MAG: LON peptidase substrate-binding domain-containing protein [Gemmatimonadota bacterium]|jgi:Lon protease-like protein|nr:LON peptidase substrate-binding domain-containing protein [Gemmatimonadota bacterium]
MSPPAERLPLFPLAVVLLPGTALPLHIFEPRYRRMVADALAGSREFGLLYLPPGWRDDEVPGGWPLTVARIEEHEPLPDGRSNILVRGMRRVALSAFVADDAPYRVGTVTDAPDLPGSGESLEPLAAQARQLFARVAAAARAVADDPDPAPPLPADAALLAYAIAAAVDLDPEARHRLLATRDPGERLALVLGLLTPVAADLERRAAVHARSRTNGHGPH